MRKFSNEQLLAVNTNSMHTAVIAGAGSGKTTVLIERINKILIECNPSDKILGITFTKKAANEMKERLNKTEVSIMTFDAFCYNIINNDKLKIINDDISFTRKEVLSFNLYDANLKKIKKPKKYDEYVKYKNNNNLYDFFDIEYEALKIIKTNKIKYDYILIDEFQDTNNLQYLIFKNLISKNTKTFIVGDPDQSIYRFRGANNMIIFDYVKYYHAKLIKLEDNYRSSKEIVESANKLINRNKNRIKKNLVYKSEKDGKVYEIFFSSEILEYNYIVSTFERLKKNYKSFAILFRNHEQGYIYKKYFYNRYENIEILSIHESKGLEFDVVFLIGINKNVIPSNYENTNLEIEEERRLMFVAVTRAKYRLYISSNKTSSKFIKELKIRK